jgi:tryptophan-rich sensory protein
LNKHFRLLGFVAGVLVVGWAIGWLTAPGPWYAGLDKPWFNPPNWVFGPVWTVLYVLIAVAGSRVWALAERSGPKGLWSAQMLLNWLWPITFFAAQAPRLSLGVIALLLVMIVLFIRSTWFLDRISAALFIPYGLWVSFATALNLAIVWLN